MTRNRIFIVLLAIATLAAMAAAAPVAAKPKPRPPETVHVTMAGDIATTCEEPFLTMRDVGYGLRADWASANTEIEIELGPFTGCHGGLVSPYGDEFAGYLILTPGPSGTVELTTRFDYTWEYGEEVCNRKGNKCDRNNTGLQLYEINAELQRTDGEPFDWAPGADAQTVAGTADLWEFDKAGAGWVSLGTDELTMTIEITSSS